MIPSLVFIFCRFKRDLSFQENEYGSVSESIWLQSNKVLWAPPFRRVTVTPPKNESAATDQLRPLPRQPFVVDSPLPSAQVM